MLFFDIQLTVVSTEQHSLTTAPKSVFNGSRLGTNLSANALQKHFTLPYENEQPIPLTIPEGRIRNIGARSSKVLTCSMSTAAVLDLW